MEMNIKRHEPDAKAPTFAETVKSLIEFHKIPVTELAGMCGVSSKSAYFWIQGKHAPPRRNEVLTQEDVIEAIEQTVELREKAKRAAELATAGDAGSEGPQGFA